MTEEDSEKRFDSLMDRLFNSPPKPNKITSRGKKRGNSVLSGSNGESNDSGGGGGGGGGGSVVPYSGLNRSLVPYGSVSSTSSRSQTPVCRPWHRWDLMKRLATFKAMTWFAKPQVVSAINCARRGWINVDMDILACEACGARLLFSNPSSWTRQQIEKAAAVFSLKLDSGHKLPCPWIDNACDELLAQFPPTPAPGLINAYKERSSAVLQLSALPVISASAIDYMRCPQLVCFLEQSSMDLGAGSIDISRTRYTDHENATSANLYYQAHKLISLCGWEPRSLPYAVDCKDWSTQVKQNGNSKELSPHTVNVRNPGVVMYSASGSDGVADFEEDPSLSALQSDAVSVVLECKLCGASAGLWAFSTVPRPLEWFRLVESLEVNGRSDSDNCDVNATGSTAGALRLDESSKDNHVSSNGGTVGTPTSIKERSLSLNLSIAGGPPPEKQNYRATVSLPIISRYLRAGRSSNGDGGTRVSRFSSMEQESSQCNSTNPCSLQQENAHRIPCSPLTMPTADNSAHQLGEVSSESGKVSMSVSSSPKENAITDNACTMITEKDNISSYHKNSLDSEATNENIEGVANTVLPPVNNREGSTEEEGVVKNTMQLTLHGGNIESNGLGKDLKRVQSDQAMEFDPIRQHRHFCPWIVSTGKTGPGWRQTLSALDREKASPRIALPESLSSSLFEDDDPVTSVRNLFKSPSTKRTRISRDLRWKVNEGLS